MRHESHLDFVPTGRNSDVTYSKDLFCPSASPLHPPKSDTRGVPSLDKVTKINLIM